MRKKIIVVGLGQVGYRVTNLLLALGEEVVVITESARAEWMRGATESGARIILGDARDEQFLLQAGLLDADALIVCTSSDAANIEISLDARRLHPAGKIVARLFDANLARHLEGPLGIDKALAMSIVAAPAFASAAVGDEVIAEFDFEDSRLRIARLKVDENHPIRLHTVDQLADDLGVSVLFKVDQEGQVSHGMTGDSKFKSAETAKLIGTPTTISKLLGRGGENTRPSRASILRRLAGAANPVELFKAISYVWSHTGIELRTIFASLVMLILISVVVFRYAMNLTPVDAFYFVVATVTTTGYGDISPKDASPALKIFTSIVMLLGSAAVATFYSIVTDYIVTSRLLQLVGRQRIPESGHVIVAGLGDVGYRVIDELLRDGVAVVGIDLDPNSKHVLSLRSRIPIVVGDAREEDVLKRAACAHAAAIVVLSGDDAVNLSVGLAAGNLNSELRSVLRIFESNFARKVGQLDRIASAMSASKIAASAFVSSALYDDALASFVLHGNLFTLTPSSSGQREEPVRFVRVALGPERFGTLAMYSRPLLGEDVVPQP